MCKFLPTIGFNWIDPKSFDLNKCNSNGRIANRGCFLEVDLKYPKNIRKIHYDYPLAPDKIDIKKEMQSSYQLKIGDFYSIGTVQIWA